MCAIDGHTYAPIRLPWGPFRSTPPANTQHPVQGCILIVTPSARHIREALSGCRCFAGEQETSLHLYIKTAPLSGCRCFAGKQETSLHLYIKTAPTLKIALFYSLELQQF